MTDIEAKYKDILNYIKQKNIKVYHRAFNNGADGHYDVDSMIITIDKKIRNTLTGCYVLCHEYCHAVDHKYGKFKNFYQIDEKTEYSEYIMNVITDAEVATSKAAVRMLKMWDLSYLPDDLTESGLKTCIKFWKKYYFDEN